MKLTNDTVAEIVFTLTSDSFEGEIIEKVKETEPFEFLVGSQVLLQNFENKLEGLHQGEDFKFFLTKAEAYGNYLPEMVITIEKQLITEQIEDPEMLEEELQVDNYIPMLDPDGNELSGRILEIGEDMVTLDFNHPLADRDLYFVGKVLSLRPASADEIMKGHAIHVTQWQDAGPDEKVNCHA